MSAVDVCNEALGRIGHGASQPIQSLDDTSEAARACKRVFRQAMRRTLREYRWPFAQVLRSLAQVTQEVPGWAYAYQYPADCLFLHAIGIPGYDVRQAPFNSVQVEYSVVRSTDGQSRIVATHSENATAWYTADVEDPDQTDVTFQDALAWRVATELAIGLKAEPQVARWASDQYAIAVSTASALAHNEAGHGMNGLPENVAARLDGSAWDVWGGRR